MPAMVRTRAPCSGIQAASVLIVEDEVFTREIAMMMAEDWGYSPSSASDVPEAMAILRSTQHVSVLFTDIYLKTEVQGGCDLAREAVRLRPAIRVLYTTGNAASDKLKAQFVAGAHFIPKPYSPDQLKSALEDLIAH
jgi:CheY-like chemotaxis protein